MDPELKNQKYQMDFMEKITLSPIEKYVRFNKFPWKLLVHMGLLIFTTLQVYSVIGLRGDHNRSIQQSLKYILFNQDQQSDQTTFQTLTEFQAHLSQVTSSFLNLDSLVYQMIDVDKAHFHIQVQYLTVDQKNIRPVIYDLDLHKGIVEPFQTQDIDSIREFMNQVSSFSIMADSLTFKTYYELSDQPLHEQDYYCMNWSVRLNYDFSSFASVKSTFETNSYYCDLPGSHDLGHSHLIVHLVVLLLAFVSLVLSGRYVYEIAKDYMHYMTLYKKVKQLVDDHHYHSSTHNNQTEKLLQFKQTWEELSIFDKLRFFDFWFLFGIIGNFIQINACIISVLFLFVKQPLRIYNVQESMVGFGCGFSWLMMLKYLEYNPNINIMTSTLKKSSNNIFKFFLGVFPVFIAFCLFAQCLFWKYEQFQSLNSTIIILFSLSYGDIVYDTFKAVIPEGFIGQIFLIIFMLLFYTAVQNVFITIIMDGYEKTRQEIKNKRNIKKYGENYQKEDTVNSSQNNNPKLVRMKTHNIEMAGSQSPQVQVSDFRSQQQKLEKILKEEGQMTRQLSQREEKEPDDLRLEVKEINLINQLVQEKQEEEEEAKLISSASEDEQGKGEAEIVQELQGEEEGEENKEQYGQENKEQQEEKKEGPQQIDWQNILDGHQEVTDKDKILNKLKIHITKINKVLEELEKIPSQIEHTDFKTQDKIKLLEYYKTNVDNVCGNIKFHIRMNK